MPGLRPAIAACLVTLPPALFLITKSHAALRYPFRNIGWRGLPALLFVYGFCQQLSAVLLPAAALEAYWASTSPYPGGLLHAAAAGGLLAAGGLTLALHCSKHAARVWVGRKGAEGLPDVSLPLPGGLGEGGAAPGPDEPLVPSLSSPLMRTSRGSAPGLRSLLHPGYWDLSRECTCLFRPRPTWAMRRVELVKDIVYHRMDGVELKLDVLRHPDISRGSPTLLYFHGGSWTCGDKGGSSLPLLYHFAFRMKWLVVTTNYRLGKGGAVAWPGQLHDCYHALAWARSAEAEQYGGGGDFLAVCGDSAGAHLACLVGFTWREERMLPPDARGRDLRVDAVIDLYGVHDPRDLDGERARYFNMEEWNTKRHASRVLFQCPLDDDPGHVATWNEGSPHWWVEQMSLGRATPAVPIFTLGCEHDTLVPVVDWRRFSAALRQMREDTGGLSACDLHIEVPRTVHGFNMMNGPASFALTDVVQRFLHVAARRAGPR